MPSERQLEANRRNGRLGGLKTQEGKRRSRMNSLRHGLTSTTLVVLPEEDGREYEEIRRGFRESLNPPPRFKTPWRGLRLRRVETGMLDIIAASQRDLAKQAVENCPEHLDAHKAIGVVFRPVAQLASLRHHLARLLPNARHAHPAPARAPDETRRRDVHHGRCRSSGSVRFRDSVRFVGSP